MPDRKGHIIPFIGNIQKKQIHKERNQISVIASGYGKWEIKSDYLIGQQNILELDSSILVVVLVSISSQFKDTLS